MNCITEISAHNVEILLISYIKAEYLNVVCNEQTLKEGDLLWPINHLYSNKWNHKKSKTRKFWNRNRNGIEMESEPES